VTAAFLIALVAVATTLLLARSVRPEPAVSRTVALVPTPRERAEQILAARYARGTLSPQEYQRSLAVLRR